MADHMQKFEELLRGADLRVTHQRKVIISTLAGCDDHPRAEDVYDRVREIDDSISFATVYRTLAALADAGIVQRIAVDEGPARFEMAPKEDHDHMVDIDSGEVIELISDELIALRRKLARELGYDVISHHSVLRVRKLKE